MSITAADGSIIVEFKSSTVNGRPAIGAYLILFSVNYITHSWEHKHFKFNNIAAKVFVGKDNRLLGHAAPEFPISFIPKQLTQSGSVAFELLLTGQIIENIEKIRNGGDIQISLKIHGEMNDKLNNIHAEDTVTFYINQKSWIDILKQIEYGNYLFYELPIDIKPTDKTIAAIKAFEKAKSHLYYGNYDEVVAACRIALESTVNNNELVASRKSTKERPKSMSKSERITHAIDSIMNITHLATHHTENDKRSPFTREEAIFILSTTAAAISSKNGNL